MDEGDVWVSLFRKSSFPRKSWKSWMTLLTTCLESEKNRLKKMWKPSIIRKKLTQILITLLTSSSEVSVNSTNPSSTQSQASSCKTMEPDSTLAVLSSLFSNGMEWSQQWWSGYSSAWNRAKHRSSHNLRHANLMFYLQYSNQIF